MVDRKFVEAADALRFEMVNAHDGSFAPFVDRSLKDKIEAYDTARSRLAAAQPAEHPESIGGLASRTPASKQGKKALDDMLLVFAKHDDDEEDCWTQPARLGMQYVSDLEWDLETHVNRSAILAETNDTLRGFIDCLAAFTGTHFGADEPLKNYERVRKALTDKPEPPSPAAPEESAPLTDAEAQRLYDDAGATARPFGAHEVERFVRTTVDPASEILALQKQRNDVYEERDRLVAALSKCFPSWLARHPDADKEWDDQWRWIVFVQLPTGQATWHIHDRELPWFDHLVRRTVNEWDGHTTEEKYRRLEALAPLTGGEGVPTIEECVRAAHEAIKRKHPHAAVLAAALTEDERECVMAVRSLCLSRRAPASGATWRVEVRGSQPQCWVVVDPSGEAGEQSFTVGPCFDADEREDAEHFARMTRTALERLASRAPSSRLVEAADAMRALFPKAAHDCLLRECSIVDAYDTVRDLCLASRSPSHDLVEAADAMYARLEEKNDDSRYSTRELLDSYDRARARYAEGAQASGAPAKWRVEVVHGRARLIVDASGDSGEQSFWINDADTDDEPGHAEFHARMLRIAIGRIVGAPAPASAQGDESAWLIERPGPLWWSGREGCGAWTTATDALRFARWEDADRMRRVMGFDDAKATEHIWCAPPSSEKTGEAHK